MENPWSRIDGIEIQISDEKLKSPEFNDSEKDHSPHAIIYPISVQEVVHIVRIANDKKSPLYTISKGKNWGFGSATSALPGCAILDLSKMNRISQYNPEMGTVRVQPGVSFIQLARFLKKMGDQWQASITGGPPSGSVLGNALERGDGSGHHGDRAQSIFDLEVVMGTGQIISTGLKEFGFSNISWHSHPPGPQLDQLFVQSNFGIVCGANIKLEPKNQYCVHANATIKTDEDWRLWIVLLRKLIDENILSPRCVSIWNYGKLLSRISEINLLGKDWISSDELNSWVISFYIPSQSSKIAFAKMNIVKSIIGKKHSAKMKIEICSNIFDGFPTRTNLNSLYWQKDNPPIQNLDPNINELGVMWVCPNSPLNQRKLCTTISILERNSIKEGFLPNIGLQLTSRNSANLFLLITYEKTDSCKSKKAYSVRKNIFSELDKAGIPQARLGISSMHWMRRASKSYAAVLQQIKKSLDPNNILSPGRYLLTDWDGLFLSTSQNELP